ncbi:lysophospholipid transporter LplT [Parvibium lacunae]|uniref:Lysophospholipid transporter LplT n=1 Tax=Parvibium lacunae TaxID=1888893 RepID=A0A368L7M5_9BURK|nr:lysophospholipid transporter LplT [Parvibium lacunae]RCS59670.1 lysophospholipid transporter LplT [Parvibium lacunae]
MKPGFYTIMAAQFFSSLADNALLIAAIALLAELNSPAWMSPLLKLFFVISYVVLAAFVGAFADSMPKGRVMLITNSIKIVGCSMMFFGVHPLLSYAVVGFGAAAYSPAKYGILTELLPAEKLVAANGWIEGLTVGSIILGTLVGGLLISPKLSATLLGLDLPFVQTGIDSPAESAIVIIAIIYLLAAFCNLHIPDTGARYPHQERHPLKLLVEFSHCCQTLWKDKLGQISLAVTTLFWGAGATLQFIVLDWASESLHLPLYQSTYLQGIVAVGIAVGAISAASRIPLKRSLSVLPMGVAMGVLSAGLGFYDDTFFVGHYISFNLFGHALSLPLYLAVAGILLMIIGGFAGFFVVPMNALLQHRGHILMSAGHSIAVQNFNENLSVLSMLGLYALLLKVDIGVDIVIISFGVFVAVNMYLVIRWHQANQRAFDATALIGEHKH